MLKRLKIYVEGRPVFLLEGQPEHAEEAWRKKHPTVYHGNLDDVKLAIEMLESDPSIKSLTIYGSDLKAVKASFKKLARTIDAAGGFVTNPNGKILMIFRRGKWDLPKGKVDPGETIKEAALREVEEETGIRNLELGKLIVQTYHVYKDRKGRVLKRTSWYSMRIRDKQQGVPEESEGISEVRWIKGSLAKKLRQTFPNILEVFREAGRMPESFKD